jgi:hypothetical protein
MSILTGINLTFFYGKPIITELYTLALSLSSGILLSRFMKDHQSFKKNLLSINGVGSFEYHCANYIIDYMSFCIFLAFYIINILGEKEIPMNLYSKWALMTIMELVCFGVSMIPLVYLFGYFFRKNERKAMNLISISFFCFGYLLCVSLESI